MGFHGNSDQQRHHNGERTMSPSENDDTGRKLHNRQSRFNLSDIMKLIVSPPLLMQQAAKDPGRRSSASSLLLPPRFQRPLMVLRLSTSTLCNNTAHYWPTVSHSFSLIGYSVTFPHHQISIIATLCFISSFCPSVTPPPQGCQTFLLWSCHTPCFLWASLLLALPWQ